MGKYDQLREDALANFELLLSKWGIEYEKVGAWEYDFKNPARNDANFGACRFNLKKGRGADFALRTELENSNFGLLGKGFSRGDFASYDGHTQTRIGFDVIGLCQRCCHLSRYQDGVKRLSADIRELLANGQGAKAARDAIEQRRKRDYEDNINKVNIAKKIWRGCERVIWEGSAAHKYLMRRGIDFEDPNMRAHPNLGLGTARHPALIFKVAKEPTGALVAVHRIFLSSDGHKADITEPKMALARISGAGIWLGKPGEELWIAEGPEEALSYRDVGADFVVSTISSFNYHLLSIPDCVQRLILAPDKDAAGETAYQKALKAYSKYPIRRGELG